MKGALTCGNRGGDPSKQPRSSPIDETIGTTANHLKAGPMQLQLSEGQAPMLPVCSNCAAPAKSARRGWCRPCYLRWFKAGKPESGPPPVQNDLMARWRQVPEIANKREPTDLDVGTAGEHLVCADLLLGGYIAFRTDQSCAYDIAVDLGSRLVRLQVKSTRTAKKVPQRLASTEAYQWGVRRVGKGGRRLYGEGEFDLLALVGLDIRQVAYVPPSLTRQTFQIRTPSAAEGKQFSDFPFARALTEIGAVT